MKSWRQPVIKKKTHLYLRIYSATEQFAWSLGLQCYLGERERAHLVVQLGLAVCMYVFMYPVDPCTRYR